MLNSEANLKALKAFLHSQVSHPSLKPCLSSLRQSHKSSTLSLVSKVQSCGCNENHNEIWRFTMMNLWPKKVILRSSHSAMHLPTLRPSSHDILLSIEVRDVKIICIRRYTVSFSRSTAVPLSGASHTVNCDFHIRIQFRSELFGNLNTKTRTSSCVVFWKAVTEWNPWLDLHSLCIRFIHSLLELWSQIMLMKLSHPYL